jgi:hypothetical protein
LFISGLEDEKSLALVVDGEGTQTQDVRGYIHAVCKVGRYAKYRATDYSQPTNWSTPKTISDGWIGKGLAITARPTNGTYYPYATWTDSRTKNIYFSTSVETPLIVAISPTYVRMYVGQSQTFSSSVSGGTPPYAYQWYLNDTAVPGATGSSWTFTPRSTGNYKVYLWVTDDLKIKAKSNVVSDVFVCSLHLLLTVEPNQATYMPNQPVTFAVSVLNQLNPSLDATLTLTVTGPGNYYFFDFQRITVAADSVDECSFDWKAPDAAGTYVVEVSLIPPRLTAYDAVWLEVA